MPVAPLRPGARAAEATGSASPPPSRRRAWWSTPARPGLPALTAGCLLLALASLLLPVTVTYDPWAWLVWGREVAGLDLDTRGGGPAWKPLPVLVNALLSPLGDVTPYAWLVVARFGGLLALALAYRLAAGALGGRTGVGAGITAAVLLVSSTGYVADLSLPGMSEPLLAALALLAVDRHLTGARGQALAALTAAALLRPEAWPFLAGYAALRWWQEREHRGRLTLVAAGAGLLVLLMWFGGEWWGSGDPFRSSTRAGVPTEGGPLLTDSPATAVLVSLARYPVAAAWVGALLALAAAVAGTTTRRRPAWSRRLVPLVVALAALSLGWAAVVTGMVATGRSAGDQRYLIVATAGLAVLGGVAWAWAARWAVERLRAGAWPQRLAGSIALGGVAAAVAWTVPVLGARADYEQGRLALRQSQDERVAVLEDAVRQAGGRAPLLACGAVTTAPYEVPIVAWALDVSLPDVLLDVRVPGVVLRSLAGPGVAAAPAVPPTYRAWPLTGDAGVEWQVLATCPPPRVG